MARSEEAIVEAARGDIPARFVRLLGISISPDGHAAVALLDTNAVGSSDPYPLQVHCYRDDTGWHEAGSSNGYGWSVIGGGVVTYWDRAPADVREVIVRWRDEEHRVPTAYGFFLFARWAVPEGDHFMSPVRFVKANGSTSECMSPQEFEDRRRAAQQMFDRLRAFAASRTSQEGNGIWIERKEGKKS